MKIQGFLNRCFGVVRSYVLVLKRQTYNRCVLNRNKRKRERLNVNTLLKYVGSTRDESLPVVSSPNCTFIFITMVLSVFLDE